MLSQKRTILSVLVSVLIIASLIVTLHVGFFTISPLALDGSGSVRKSGITSVSVSLTTTKAPDLIIAVVASNNSAPVTMFDGNGLSWTTRENLVTSNPTLVELYAITNNVLTSDSITVSQNTPSNINLLVFAISGANTTSPFDGNSKVPATAVGSGTLASTSISTNSNDDMIIGLISIRTESGLSAGSGFTLITPAPENNPLVDSEYQTFSAPQSGINVEYNLPTAATWTMISDAIQATSRTQSGSGGGSGTSSSSTQMTTTTTESNVSGVSVANTSTTSMTALNAGFSSFLTTYTGLAPIQFFELLFVLLIIFVGTIIILRRRKASH